MDEEILDWHRLFGLVLTDFFTGSPFTVDVEKDLSMKKQLLDVVILRRKEGPLLVQLPDGVGELAPHNLLTFKSHRETLDRFAMKELACHSVNYQKQAGPEPNVLLPEDQIRLYAVCARYPHNLAQEVPWVRVQQGVYDFTWATDVIRVLVLGQLPQAEQNAMLHLFSASQELLRYGSAHYRQRSPDTSTLLLRLVEKYRKEGLEMSYTMEDFRRDFAREHLQELVKGLTAEQLRALLPPEERVKGLSPEQLRALLPPEERVAGLSPEQRLAGLSPEHFLAGLSAELKEVLRKQLLEGEPSPPSP
jgi:hypothetical protein